MYDEMMKRQQKAKEAEEAEREKVCFSSSVVIP